MANSDPDWMSRPFGHGWEDIDRHVQRIEGVWESPAFPGGAVSEKTENQMALLQVAVRRMTEHMKSTWAAEPWAAFRRSLDPLPSHAALSERLAKIEYQLVSAWHAQQVQAYWASLSETERHRQQAQIREHVNRLPPLSVEL